MVLSLPGMVCVYKGCTKTTQIILQRKGYAHYTLLSINYAVYNAYVLHNYVCSFSYTVLV